MSKEEHQPRTPLSKAQKVVIAIALREGISGRILAEGFGVSGPRIYQIYKEHYGEGVSKHRKRRGWGVAERVKHISEDNETKPRR